MKRQSQTNQSRATAQTQDKSDEKILVCDACIKIQQKWQPSNSFIIKASSFASFPYEQITKIKIKAQKGCSGMYQVKITVKEKDYFMCLSVKDQIASFTQLIRNKLIKQINKNPHEQMFINLCEGFILKKQFFFGWDKCYLFISKAGLTCSKSKQTQSFLFISKIKQIWTRFQYIQKNAYVVFKTKQGLMKYQFAVPVDNAIKWARALCSLIEYQQ